MMKMNLIAGLVCVTLLSACSSQKIAAGDGTSGNTAATMSTPATNETPARPSNASVPAVKGAPASSGLKVTK